MWQADTNYKEDELMKTKRARIIGKRQFQIETVDFPKVNGSPVIRVTHVGICGSDVHIWEVGDSAGKDIVLGHEYTGVVEDQGNTSLKKGDRVVGYTQNPENKSCGYCPACLKGDFANCTNRTVKIALGCHVAHPGAYSEYVTWYPSAMYRLPDNVTNEEAALIEPAAVGLHAVGLSEIKPGAKVLVLGGGIIGLCVADWARTYGAEKIVMTELNKEKIKRIKGFRVVDAIYEADDPELQAKLRAEVPEGYDIIFDCVALEGPLNMSLKLLKRDGSCVLVGLNFHKVPVDVYELVVFQKRIQGSKGHVPDDFKAVLQALETGKLNLKKYITKKIGLDEVQAAFEDIKRNGNDIKVLIEF